MIRGGEEAGIVVATEVENTSREACTAIEEVEVLGGIRESKK